MTQAPEVDLDALLEIAQEAAAAGAAVLAQRSDVSPSGTKLGWESSGIDTKSSPSDLVTDFDRRAEQAVREVLAHHRPDDVVSGEEYGTMTPSATSGYRWSIDPLDGTTNFVHGIVYYGTSVGVMNPEGDWVVGVVDAPALKRRWWAQRGRGAYTSHASSAPTPLHGPKDRQGLGLLATGFGYDPERRRAQTEAINQMLPHFSNIRRLGAAALDMCMVADGTHAAFAEYGIWEHDWAAGGLIAEEAGVHVRRPAHPDGGTSPDWCVVGDLGIPLNTLHPTPTGLNPAV